MQYQLDSDRSEKFTKTNAYDSLISKLLEVKLSKEEEFYLLRIMCQAIACDHPEREPSNDHSKFITRLSNAITSLSPAGILVPPKGYVWKGHLPFLSEKEISLLTKEASRQREFSVKATKHYLLEGSSFASSILLRNEFTKFISRVTKDKCSVKPTSTFYHWYNLPTHRVEPHVDVTKFGLSVLMLLSNNFESDARASEFFVYPPDNKPTKLKLAEGEAVVLYSGSTVHARSAPNPGENVLTVSWGFEIVEQDK